jgi:glucan phosphoethanolaminetransferase (alkaline phosphatase superfamily)
MGGFIASWWWIILVILLVVMLYFRARWRAEERRQRALYYPLADLLLSVRSQQYLSACHLTLILLDGLLRFLERIPSSDFTLEPCR